MKWNKWNHIKQKPLKFKWRLPQSYKYGFRIFFPDYFLTSVLKILPIMSITPILWYLKPEARQDPWSLSLFPFKWYSGQTYTELTKDYILNFKTLITPVQSPFSQGRILMGKHLCNSKQSFFRGTNVRKRTEKKTLLNSVSF